MSKRSIDQHGVIDERGRLWTWFQIERAGEERRRARAAEPMRFVGYDEDGMAIYRDGEGDATESR